jgi:hypothetical protein
MFKKSNPMNIESLIDKIDLFNELIIESGFRRDVNDFIQSIQQAQNRNLVFMKDLSSKVKTSLINVSNYSLESELKSVLRDSDPFTDLDTMTKLEEIDVDTEIDADAYFQEFNSILAQLLQSIDTNKTEIDNIRKVFEKYIANSSEFEAEEKQALMSLIFKDLKTTGSLKEFSRVLSRWNRTLIIYHTLIKSESPDDISLVEIQNGSIDVIFNIDIDVAVDLTELIKVGLKVYGVYLLYKSKRAREIIDSYMGNKRLIQMEKERETLMLDNIKESIANKALEQHKERLKLDKKIDKTGVEKKIEEISSVVTDHIIKGNEIKLLTPPKKEDESDENNLSDELREDTAIVRERFKNLNSKDKQLLLEKYSFKDSDEKKEAE